jgi:menaquinone-9 beta-reductase
LAEARPLYHKLSCGRGQGFNHDVVLSRERTSNRLRFVAFWTVIRTVSSSVLRRFEPEAYVTRVPQTLSASPGGKFLSSLEYDIITIGGGLGGAALAGTMAEQGARVLVLEREKQFKDRVRGEGLTWGLEDARSLGLYELLRDRCDGLALNGVTVRWGSLKLPPRDLTATTPYHLQFQTLYHPLMQENVLAWAAEKGAEVRRGVSVTSIECGNTPAVTTSTNGNSERRLARLIVGADGRYSMARKWGGFFQQQDPQQNIVCGVMMENMHAPKDVFQWLMEPDLGLVVVIFPQSELTRAYLVYPHTAPYRLQNQRELPRFVEESARVAPPEFYSGAKPVGPLASFSGADVWVDHPYHDGVALIGDAAAASDPTYGQGLQLTLRDVRVLRDALVTNSNWDRAGHSYASTHDWHYGVIHRIGNWMSELLLSPGSQAAARRERVFRLAAEDPTRLPDHIMSGPELPADEMARRRFFGEL